MKLIASTELWTSRIAFDAPRTHQQMQAHVRECAEATGISIVGYAQATSLTLLRWPDLRDGYHEPTPEECNLVTGKLAVALDRVATVNDMPDGAIHTMAGRRIGGYDTNTVASLVDVATHAPHLALSDGYMVSARVHDGQVEEYGEPVAVVTGNSMYESEVHAAGDALQQHHYVIERRSEGRTDFYETKWAVNET